MIFKRFTPWSKDNKLLKIFELLSKHADLEWVFIDASHIRAHQHATGLKDQGWKQLSNQFINKLQWEPN